MDGVDLQCPPYLQHISCHWFLPNLRLYTNMHLNPSNVALTTCKGDPLNGSTQPTHACMQPRESMHCLFYCRFGLCGHTEVVYLQHQMHWEAPKPKKKRIDSARLFFFCCELGTPYLAFVPVFYRWKVPKNFLVVLSLPNTPQHS